METSNNTTQEIKKFVAPTKAEDFAPGQTEIKHTYENGHSVVFVLLSNGEVATIREGLGTDIESATLESDGNKDKYLSAMIAATTKINGRQLNMYELGAYKMKDYLKIQAAFAGLNF